MKAILSVRWKNGKSELHGVYESTEEFLRLNKVRKTPFNNRYNDNEYSYQLVEIPFFTNNGTHFSIDKGMPVITTRVLRDVKHKIPMKTERKYNYMTVLSAEMNYKNNKIATLCGGDFSTVKYENDN